MSCDLTQASAPWRRSGSELSSWRPTVTNHSLSQSSGTHNMQENLEMSNVDFIYSSSPWSLYLVKFIMLILSIIWWKCVDKKELSWFLAVVMWIGCSLVNGAIGHELVQVFHSLCLWLSGSLGLCSSSWWTSCRRISQSWICKSSWSCITLEFDRQLGSSADELLVEFQNN